MDIPKRYETAREHLNLKVVEIAEQAELDKGTISKIEGGQTKLISLKYVDFLVRKGINFEYLMGRSEILTVDSQSDPTLLQKQIADLKHELSETQKDLAGTKNDLDRCIKHLLSIVDEKNKADQEIKEQALKIYNLTIELENLPNPDYQALTHLYERTPANMITIEDMDNFSEDLLDRLSGLKTANKDDYAFFEGMLTQFLNDLRTNIKNWQTRYRLGKHKNVSLPENVEIFDFTKVGLQLGMIEMERIILAHLN